MVDVLHPADRIVVVTRERGQPRIHVYDLAWNLLHLNPLNLPPTAVRLDPASFDEGQAAGAVVGTFSCTDPFPGITHSYELDVENSDGGFAVDNGQLVTTREFDYFTDDRDYTLWVRAVDRFGFASDYEQIDVTLSHVPRPPLSLSLVPGTFREGDEASWQGGAFQATDRDPDTTLVFEWVGASSDALALDQNRLVTARALTAEDVGEVTFTVRVVNGHGLHREETFNLSIGPAPRFTFTETPPAEVANENLQWTGTLDTFQPTDMLELRLNGESLGQWSASELFDLSAELREPGANTVTLIHRDAEGREQLHTYAVEWKPPRILEWRGSTSAREGGRLDRELWLLHDGGVDGFTLKTAFDPARVRGVRFLWHDAWFDRVYSENYDPETGVLTLVFSGGGDGIPAGELRMGRLDLDLHSADTAYTLSGTITELAMSDPEGTVWPHGSHARALEEQVEVRTLRADANGNGEIDIGDAVWLQRLVLGHETRFPHDDELNDVTGDELLTNADAQQVLFMVAGLREPMEHETAPVAAVAAESMSADVEAEAPSDPVSSTDSSVSENPDWDTGPVRFAAQRTVGAQGTTVEVLLNGTWDGNPPAGISFRLEYPEEAVRFTQYSDHSFANALSSSGVLKLWNPDTGTSTPLDYTSQTGSLHACAASSEAWTPTGNGLARFVFHVDAGALTHDWPLVVTDVEVAYEDGRTVAVPGSLTVFSTQNTSIMSYQTWATHSVRPFSSRKPVRRPIPCGNPMPSAITRAWMMRKPGPLPLS